MPKVITTIHLEESSPDSLFERAAYHLMLATTGKWKDENSQKMFVNHLRDMVHRVSGPFEFRTAPGNEPIFVVHPKTRAAGEAAKKEAISQGQWSDSTLIV